ncbi:cyclin-like protein, partial [Fomitopsis serialis]|uniref:cyclin-like protein n=1 Tax=Fomitopsis serialis TaxID=139415 RepID=UPI002008316F
MDGSQFLASYVKHHLPYFTPAEVEKLSDKQRGKLSITQEEKARQQACGFIEAVGAKIGLKTIATAQNLYHRFHLFFPRKDFSYYDVTLAALYVSSKMHDTLKKPREILMISYGVRYPELVAKSKSIVGEIDMDPQTVELDRQRLLAVERLMLETICFNFTSRMPFPYVIKIGRSLGATKKLTKLAWRLTIDSFRTLVNLDCVLTPFDQTSSPDGPDSAVCHQIVAWLSKPEAWERQFQAHVEDLEEIAFAHQPNTSPTTPSSPSPHLSRAQAIVMRQSEHPPRQRESLAQSAEYEASLLGRMKGRTATSMADVSRSWAVRHK